MTVRDIMTTEPTVCALETTLAEGAHLMWEGDCGILPVAHEGKLVGVVTNRDMFIALATHSKLASELTVGEVATKAVWGCTPDDDVHAALEILKTHRVRRLPVVGIGDTVAGIVSMSDLVRAGGSRKAIRNEDVVDTIRAIGAHRRPLAHVVAA